MCEDTHTSYWPEFSGGGLKKSTSFTEYAKTVSDMVNVEYFKGLDRHPDNMMLADFYHGLTSTHFYDSVVVFEKNGKVVPERLGGVYNG